MHRSQKKEPPSLPLRNERNLPHLRLLGTTCPISLNVVLDLSHPKSFGLTLREKGELTLDHPLYFWCFYGCFQNFKPISHESEPRSYPPHLGIQMGRKATTKVQGSKPSNRTCKADSHRSPDTKKPPPAIHPHGLSNGLSSHRGSWGTWGSGGLQPPINLGSLFKRY